MTGSEPPSQKSFCTSTMISARISLSSMETVGIAGSPRESLRPSHGTETSAARRCSRDCSSVGRSSTGSPPRSSGTGTTRSCGPSSGGAVRRCTTSSTAVPVGLYRRTADFAPPRDSFDALRLATGRPSTSTSL